MDFEIGQLCGPLSYGKILPPICLPARVAGLMSAKHRPRSPSLKGALRGACPASPASSQLGPVQHPAVSFPLQDQSVLPPKLRVCICNPAGVVYFKGIIILLVGAISQEANFLEICLGCAPLAKGHLSSSPFYQ